MKQPSTIIKSNPFNSFVLPDKWEWTVSAMKLFRNCKRKFFWKYIACIEPKKLSSSLFIGTIVHEILAKLYSGESTEAISEIIAKAEKSFDVAMWDQDEMDKAVIILETVAGMMQAYLEVYSNDTMGIDCTSIEKRYNVETSLYRFSGKIDLVTQDTLWDHKTSSYIDSSYLSRLPLDTQIRGYAYLLYKNKLSPKKAVYNCIKKCALRRKSGETRDEFCARIKSDYIGRARTYFHRETVQLSMDDLRSFEFELNQVDAEFRAIRNRPDWSNPRNWGINCSYCNAYFKDCAYLPLCTQGLDDSAKLMYDQTERNKELEDATE